MWKPRYFNWVPLVARKVEKCFNVEKKPTTTLTANPYNHHLVKIMADINQFLRSKEQLGEMLRALNRSKVWDIHTMAYIKQIEEAIALIDFKIEEYMARLQPDGAISAA